MQLRHRRDDNEKVVDLQYQLNGAEVKYFRSQKAVKSLQSQLDIVQATVNSYLWGLRNVTELVKTEVTDSFGGFLFQIQQEARMLISKQPVTIEWTVQTDLEDVYAFVCSLAYNLSLAGHLSVTEIRRALYCFCIIWSLFGSFCVVVVASFCLQCIYCPLA